MYVADTTLIVYQACEGKGSVNMLALPSKQNWALRPLQGRQRRRAWLHARVCACPGTGETASMVPAGGSG